MSPALHARLRPLEGAGVRDTEDEKDHFTTRGGVTYAGMHLIADFWGARRLSDKKLMKSALVRAVEAAGATLLYVHVQDMPYGRLAAVAVLAESHISVHCWPRMGYAAFDIFMCGNAEPKRALAVLEATFHPERVEKGEHKRGVLF